MNHILSMNGITVTGRIILYSFLYTSVVWISGTSCSSPSSSSSPARDTAYQKLVLQKIRLDLNEIDEEGLIGPADGKRSVAYEFCIPVEKSKRKEVAAIDTSVRFFLGPKGRIGCTEEYLCIGNGGTREILLKLASLDYIKRIDPFYGE